MLAIDSAVSTTRKHDDKDVRRPPRRVAQHSLRDKLRVRRRVIVSLLLLGGIIVSSAREADAWAWRSFHSSPYETMLALPVS